MNGFQSFAVGRHDNQDMKAEGNMTIKSEIMQNQTKALSQPLVRRSKVTPKEILDKVAAKQDMVAPMYILLARTNASSILTVQMCLPSPSGRPA